MSKLPDPNGGYWYGGAIKLSDANNVSYLGGIAARDKLSSSDPARFRFEVHRMGSNGSLTWLPLEDGDLTGKGSLYVDHSTGQGRYTSTNGKTSYDGPIPGFAPFVTTSGPNCPNIPIPPGGALSQLYTGVYVAQDFDTPAETALRVQKQLDAIQELITLLQKACVLA